MDKNPFKNFVPNLFLLAVRTEFEPLSDRQLLRLYNQRRNALVFAEVVRRHGAMVWAVCRRILRNWQDVEDAYQATFLKLVLPATYVQRYESVESWLHTVARNVAINVKPKRDRQRAREERRAKMHEEGYSNPRDTEDLAAILDEELGYLPKKCRSPIILCYLEGLTQEQAARRIHISARCLKRRLAEGRQRLHQRLSKRGINVDSSKLVAGLTSHLDSQQVPPELMEKTLDMVRILTQSNDGLEAACNSGGIVMLAKNVLETSTFKTKLLLGFLLAVLVIAGGGMITCSVWWNSPEKQHQEITPGPAEKPAEKSESIDGVSTFK